MQKKLPLWFNMSRVQTEIQKTMDHLFILANPKSLTPQRYPFCVEGRHREPAFLF
jgi:hypothetical protein